MRNYALDIVNQLVTRENDRPTLPTEIEVTPEMIHLGLLAIYGELLNWNEASDAEINKAVAACFRAMTMERGGRWAA